MSARSPGETWRRLCDLRARLRDCCEQTLRLDALGGELGLSGSRFLRRFPKAHALQSEARLARGCALLRESTLPVTEVCFEVG
jgi:transcriptional regulator GlxA family with amidase domain